MPPRHLGPPSESSLIPKPTTGRGAFLELVVIVALAIGLALLIQAFVVKPYQIPSDSMEPTLDVGQRVLVNRVVYHLHDPRIGDIVVFHPPQGADAGAVRREAAIRRAVPREAHAGGVGHQLHQADRRGARRPADIRNGHPVVNGVEAKEDFIKPCKRDNPAATCLDTITIPDDMYFMMGDNRGASDDSRFWGPVPRSWIIGEAFFTYWPPDRIGSSSVAPHAPGIRRSFSKPTLGAPRP